MLSDWFTLQISTWNMTILRYLPCLSSNFMCLIKPVLYWPSIWEDIFYRCPINHQREFVITTVTPCCRLQIVLYIHVGFSWLDTIKFQCNPHGTTNFFNFTGKLEFSVGPSKHLFQYVYYMCDFWVVNVVFGMSIAMLRQLSGLSEVGPVLCFW